MAPPRTRLAAYLRLGLGELFAQLLSFLARIVAVREYTLSGQFSAPGISGEIVSHVAKGVSLDYITLLNFPLIAKWKVVSSVTVSVNSRFIQCIIAKPLMYNLV